MMLMALSDLFFDNACLQGDWSHGVTAGRWDVQRCSSMTELSMTELGLLSDANLSRRERGVLSEDIAGVVILRLEWKHP